MGQAKVVEFVSALESIECYLCGVTFAMPANMLRTAREKGTAVTFWCPNGHPQGFVDSEAARLRRQLQQKEAELAAAHRETEFQRTLKEQAERAVSAQKAVNTRLRKRIGTGVCPCCKRTFRQLAAHMRAKHPDYVTAAQSGETA